MSGVVFPLTVFPLTLRGRSLTMVKEYTLKQENPTVFPHYQFRKVIHQGKLVINTLNPVTYVWQ
jgi:ABC-type uncharacterized transport system permease subunit